MNHNEDAVIILVMILVLGDTKEGTRVYPQLSSNRKAKPPDS